MFRVRDEREEGNSANVWTHQFTRPAAVSSGIRPSR